MDTKIMERDFPSAEIEVLPVNYRPTTGRPVQPPNYRPTTDPTYVIEWCKAGTAPDVPVIPK